MGSLPVSIEYYMHDRLGYELMFNLYRQPFFQDHQENTESKRVFLRGNSINFRQKLYSQDKGSGSFYIGQELRLSDFNYSLLLTEKVDSIQTNRRILKGNESRIEVCLLFGDRLFRAYNRHNTLTLDLYAGMGFGYRISRIPEEMTSYREIKINKLTIPVRLGFTFGFLF
jgi:hypothetical protein